jgi:hypothetical protein
VDLAAFFGTTSSRALLQGISHKGFFRGRRNRALLPNMTNNAFFRSH